MADVATRQNQMVIYPRLVRCPACRDEIRTHRLRPRSRDLSEAYLLILDEGLSPSHIAVAVDVAPGRIIEMLKGRRSFSPELWSYLNLRVGPEFANRVRYHAYQERRTRQGQPRSQPVDGRDQVLWEAGLTPAQLAQHSRLTLAQVRRELKGKGPLHPRLEFSIISLAGGATLEDLLGMRHAWS